MDKVEYLIKTFSRTKRKDYENYILNAVWQKIDCLDLRPVTQQYVKGHDNEYYLIDLYFPQINIGVEYCKCIVPPVRRNEPLNARNRASYCEQESRPTIFTYRTNLLYNEVACLRA